MKRWLPLMVVLWPLVAKAVPWDSGFEAQPDGAVDLISEGDDEIRRLKLETRCRDQVEHNFGTAGSTDTGLHALGSARCFVQGNPPTALVRDQYDSATGLPAGTALTLTETGGGTEDIGAGRCWIDTDGPNDVAGDDDDNSFRVWNETTNAWVALGSSATGGTLASVDDLGKRNLVYNGQWETTNGTGNTAVTVTAGTGVGTPVGWALSATPTLAYAASTAAQGDGEMLKVTAVGGVDEGVSQTLKGLKGSTTYYVVTRALPGSAGDSCTIRTTGAGTNVPTSGTANTIASGTAWTTLNGFFTTDATPTDVVLILESDVDGDVCNFDYVGVYETSTDKKNIPDPQIEVASSTDSTAETTDGTISTSESYIQDATGDWKREVTVPRSGYSILVLADMAAKNTGACDYGTLTLMEEVDGGGFASVRVSAFGGGIGANDPISGTLHFLRNNPNAGSKYSYQLKMDCTSGTATVNGDDALGDSSHDMNSMFTVLLIPTG